MRSRCNAIPSSQTACSDNELAEPMRGILFPKGIHLRESLVDVILSADQHVNAGGVKLLGNRQLAEVLAEHTAARAVEAPLPRDRHDTRFRRLSEVIDEPCVEGRGAVR